MPPLTTGLGAREAPLFALAGEDTLAAPLFTPLGTARPDWATSVQPSFCVAAPRPPRPPRGVPFAPLAKPLRGPRFGGAPRCEMGEGIGMPRPRAGDGVSRGELCSGIGVPRPRPRCGWKPDTAPVKVPRSGGGAAAGVSCGPVGAP